MRDQDQKKTLLKELVKGSKGLRLSNCSNMICFLTNFAIVI